MWNNARFMARTLVPATTTLLCAMLALPGFAAEKVWGFKGTITSYASGGGFTTLPDAPLGSVVRGQFRFDDTETDLDGSSSAGSYPFIATSIAIEGTSLLHLATMTSGTIEIENDVATGPDFRDSFGIATGSGVVYGDLDLNVLSIDLELDEESSPAPAVIASDALPATPPALVDFTTQKNLSIIGYTNGFANVADFDVSITEFAEPGTVDLPVIPDSVTVNPDGSVTWTFDTLGISLCVSGCWVDPPISTSFTYAMTNAALFTGIADFPSGFTNDFDVSVGASSLGTFGPGDSVDFTSFPGGGVSQFVVSGIDPGTDIAALDAFPLELTFDSSAAEFTMTSEAAAGVPTMGSTGMAVVVASLIGAGLVARTVRKTG
ncbi:MAG: hypothetical protein GY733_04655 [bacterium]|nr:hypothetical protein [bacterium]